MDKLNGKGKTGKGELVTKNERPLCVSRRRY